MDPVCCETKSWMEGANIEKLTRGPDQPFYQVSPDSLCISVWIWPFVVIFVLFLQLIDVLSFEFIYFSNFAFMEKSNAALLATRYPRVK